MNRQSRSAPASANDQKVSGLRRHARKLNEESLASIREAAARVFTARGYSAVTMDELATEAGVTRQTLYRHFPSKYEIACAFLADAWRGMRDVWLRLREHDLGDDASVRQWVGDVIDYHVARPDIRAFIELASTEARYRWVLAEEIARIIEVLGEAHPFFAAAAADRDGIAWAKAHLFIATIRERGAFLATVQDWIKRPHLERIVTDWLMAMIRSAP